MPGVDVIGAVQREISAMDANLTPFNARSMTEQIAQFMYSLRSAAWTWNLIGAFGLILASVGLAGVTAYSVAQRGHEIGIRMALGAQRSDVLGLVMKEGAVLVTAGTLIGMALTWAGIASDVRCLLLRSQRAKPSTRHCWWVRRCCLRAWHWWPAMCRRGSRCGLIQRWRCGRNR